MFKNIPKLRCVNYTLYQGRPKLKSHRNTFSQLYQGTHNVCQPHQLVSSDEDSLILMPKFHRLTCNGKTSLSLMCNDWKCWPVISGSPHKLSHKFSASFTPLLLLMSTARQCPKGRQLVTGSFPGFFFTRTSLGTRVTICEWCLSPSMYTANVPQNCTISTWAPQKYSYH